MKARRALLVSLIALLLASCDSFSIYDQFTGGRRNLVSLTLAQDTMAAYSATMVYVSGGTAPYAFQVIKENLYIPTATNLGQVNVADGWFSFVSTGAIGRIQVRVVDATGGMDSVTVTVLPQAPENVTCTQATPSNSVEISWSYGNMASIAGIRVTRINSLGVEVVSPLIPGSSYTDETVTPNATYTYRVQAVAGVWESPAVESTIKIIPN